MKKGVVAFLDALGFKGIWNRGDRDPRRIIERLQSAERIEGGPNARANLDFQVCFLSDTVVMACAFDGHPPAEVLLFVCMRVGFFLADMLGLREPRLAYRGAVSIGEYLIDGNFVIGPAIDEAAEAEKQPEGPFVWLTPSARALLPADTEERRLRATPGSDTAFYLLPFPVPLKRSVEQTYIVSPVGFANVRDTTEYLRQVVAGAPPPKPANTEALIVAIEADDEAGSRRVS